MNRLRKIQLWMKKNKIDLFLVNRTDEFFTEYIASYAERLNWISNFSGSAGKAIILKKKAYLFVDGRYVIQAKNQVNRKLFSIRSIHDYYLILEKKINLKNTIGIDATLHSIFEINQLRKIFNKKKTHIKLLKTNPIDLLWKNQPGYPKAKAFIHHVKYAGQSRESKIKLIQRKLKKESIDYYLLTSLESIAWLLNIRGNDVKYTPLVISHLIIPSFGKLELFIDKRKIIKIRKKLTKKVNFHTFNNIYSFIKKIDRNNVVGLDINKTNFSLQEICIKNKLKLKFIEDPCVYLKAQKNKIEIIGAKKANIRDAISIIKFLYWLKNKKKITNTSEIKASKYLHKIRKKNKLFYSLSFDTISAIDENAALPHYRLNKKSNKIFNKNSIYLFDSGAQYFDGTTDITRTIILGKPTKEQKDRFTRVLKGHIALATKKFSPYIKGSDLDKIARKSLNQIGCDYDHGTGHGIGSFLSVHEGPQRIAKKTGAQESLIMENMILSNEPGFYKENEYGIRTENLVIVKKHNNSLFKFETISFAPFDIDLIEIKMLSSDEIKWINAYHKKIYSKVNNKLSKKEKQWLKTITKPIKID